MFSATGERYELGIGILHHRSHLLIHFVDVRVCKRKAADRSRALDLSLEGIGDEGVDTISKGTLAAARRSDDQNLLSLADGQVDMLERRIFLRLVGEAEIRKFDERILHASARYR